jgi:phosphatidate cytidylyltransferase
VVSAVNPQRKNLLARVASAVVGLPLLGAVVLWHDPRGFAGLCFVAATLAMVEYTELTMRGRPLSERMSIVMVGCGLFLGVSMQPGLAFIWLLASVMAVGLLILPRATDPSAAWTRLTSAGFGVFYVGGMLAALPILHTRVGPAWVALAIAVTFGNDTGAYFSGRALGKRKLAPAISPGKTVEGAVGGLVANLVVAFAARGFFMSTLTVRDCVMIAVPSAVVGPAGDLVESLLKRAAGAKDSGRLIPGHGGLLDRIDALLFVGAYVCLYATQLR